MTTPSKRKAQRIESAGGITGGVTPATASGMIYVCGKYGRGDGEFKRPYGIAVGMDGLLYVSDNQNNRIQCFESNGKFVTKWGCQGNGDGEFDNPTGIAVGNMHAKVNPSILNKISAVPALVSFPPGILPICASYIGDDYLIVADTGNDRIQIFEADGKFVRKWGSKGNGDGQFDSPQGCRISVEVEPNFGGIVYVADTFNERIQIFKLDGTFVRKWGTFGESEEPSTDPVNLAVSDNRTSIYVCETLSACIECYTTHGTFIRSYPTYPHQCPIDVVISGENMFICDTNTPCICEYSLRDGIVRRKWDLDFYPQGIAKGSKNVLYVTDRNTHTIVSIDLA